MDFTNPELVELVPKGDLRAVSRLISLTENRVPRAKEVVNTILARTAHAPRVMHTIGVTGSPGAGKSTLVDQLASVLRKQGNKVGIIAIDPTSPFSGGAILGDRIRMVKTSEDPEIFIRSMATRGALGGISRATLDAVQVLQLAGFNYVLIETVGVGQAEVDIVKIADTCVVVLVPGMGDAVQTFKAGILEIADVFVINKSDRDGADLVFRDLRTLISLNESQPDGWDPPIEKTIATNGSGAEEVIAHCLAHAEWLKKSPAGLSKRSRVLESTLLMLLAEQLKEDAFSRCQNDIPALARKCASREIDLQQALEKLLTIYNS